MDDLNRAKPAHAHPHTRSPKDLKPKPLPGGNLDSRLRCPKDATIMERVQVAGVVVDRCGKCGSLWFDASELKTILKAKDKVSALDSGASTQGAAKDTKSFALAGRLCPRDSTPLATVPDDDQIHIQVDLCRSCRGVLLDAGELKDLSDFKLSERLKKWWTG